MAGMVARRGLPCWRWTSHRVVRLVAAPAELSRFENRGLGRFRRLLIADPSHQPSGAENGLSQTPQTAPSGLSTFLLGSSSE